MTKSLRGLSSRNFITTTTVEEAFVGREAIAALRASMPSPVDNLLGQLNPLSGSGEVIGVVVGAVSDDTLVFLPCCMTCGKSLDSIHGHGNLDSSLSAPPTPGGEIFDEGTLSVAVGGSVSGVIDFGGDIDTISVYLVAGQTYLVSMRGTGGTALDDSYLEVYNPTGGFVTFDDDGGTSRNSLLTFTATATGNYEIDAQAFGIGAADIGSYTVDVRVQGVDAVGFTFATSVPLSLGTTFGFREFGTGSQSFSPVLDGDTDMYAVTLQAGHFYTFEVASGWDGEAQTPGINAMNPVIVLYNAAGQVVQRGTAQNDNLGGDLSSALGTTIIDGGTYYLQVSHRVNQTGGYVIEFKDVDFSGLSPLDTINWFDADNIDTVNVAGVPTAYVYFGAAGDDFGEGLTTLGWNATEKAAVMTALIEFTKITGIQYLETANILEAEFRLNTINDAAAPFGAYFYPQDPGFGDAQGIGIFNKISGGWTIEPSPGVQPSLERGGYSFSVILHEFGHGHGLAHPHDNGGGSEIMPGMFTAAGNGTFSVYNMAQGVYTVMSYNDAWRFHPDGNSPFTVAGIDNGWSASLSALDIAVLQDRYGVHDYNTGNNVYTLIDVVDNAFYECIWDSGGTDAIAYAGTLSAIVDLTAATLDYSPTGGGVMSFLDAGPGAQLLRGGFTIANGVVIENASTGSGNDQLVGNSAANDLSGNGGADQFIGRGGDDAIHGGAGADTAFYQGNRNDYTITAILTNGVVTGFTVRDDNIAAPADDNIPIVVANEGTDTLDGIETLSFANGSIALVGSVLVYDGDGNLISTHATIQAAIDAVTTVAGYTIFAGAGTYAEDVNVTKGVRIEGVNAGVAGDGTRIAETSVKSFTISTSDVIIDGVEVTGSSNSAGVFVVAASDNFTLVNSSLNGTSDAYGILTGQVSNLNVTDNQLLGYGVGMYVSGGETTGTIDSNLFQGGGEDAFTAGGDDGLYNGIILETSHVTVSDNTFDDMYYSSIVISPFGPDTVDLATFITGNDFPGSLAERVIFVYPTNETHNVLGTEHNEGFDAETAQLAVVSGGYGYTMASTSFDGRGGSDYAWGGELGDTFIGGTGSDQLFGKGGDDSLTGGADSDLLDGGTGIDTAYFSDSVSYLDTVAGWAILSPADGNDLLQNVEVLVDGGGQRNLLVGGTGYGTLQAALTGAQTGDNVRLAAGTYTGTVNYNVGGLTVIAQPGAVQNLTYATIGAFGITILAANGNDTITTGTGNDVIFGGGGDDVINGGAGNDQLYGEGGSDTSSGGLGDDVHVVDSTADVIIENAFEGNDAVLTQVSYALTSGASVELLSTAVHSGTSAIDLTGNFLDQTIIGNYGNNVITGGVGSDVLIGLYGDDTYIVNGANSSVIEEAGAGNDIVYTSVTFALGATSEVEVLSTISHAGTTAIDLTGSNTAQTVVGNAGANVLDGKGGNDLLAGLGGADTFAFTSALGAGNVDTLFDFSVADDTIALDDAIFTALGGTLDAGEFVIGTGAADADDRIIYNSATGALFYDADGLGGAAAVQFATLTPGLALTVSDFSVI